MILYWILWFGLKSNGEYRMTERELRKALAKLPIEYTVIEIPSEDNPNLIAVRFWIDEEKDLTLS